MGMSGSPAIFSGEAKPPLANLPGEILAPGSHQFSVQAALAIEQSGHAPLDHGSTAKSDKEIDCASQDAGVFPHGKAKSPAELVIGNHGQPDKGYKHEKDCKKFEHDMSRYKIIQSN
jgi:hypothetical protein